MRYDKLINNTRKFDCDTLIPRYSYKIYQYYSNKNNGQITIVTVTISRYVFRRRR